MCSVGLILKVMRLVWMIHKMNGLEDIANDE